MVMMERAAAAIDKQRRNTSHDWTPAPLDCAADKHRSDAFWELLRRRAPFVGSILTDGSYEATRAVRPAPVVLIDCFREGLNTPAAISRALRSLDGRGHRLVRIPSADPKDTPMTAAVALALGADSVVVPVRSAAEARAVRAACSYKGSRALNIGPELPYHVAKVPAAGVELLGVPPSELAEIIAAADFVMASTANFFLAEGREQALASLASLQEACRTARQAVLPSRRRAARRVIRSEDWLLRFDQRISLPPSPARGRGRPTSWRRTRASPSSSCALRRGAKSIGQVVCAGEPRGRGRLRRVRGRLGLDRVAALVPGRRRSSRAGGGHRPAGRPLGCSNGGRPRQDRHPAMPRCRRRYRADPVHQHRRGGAGVDQALPLRAPRRPRVERQRALPLEADGADVPGRDLRMHGCARGDLPSSRRWTSASSALETWPCRWGSRRAIRCWDS